MRISQLCLIVAAALALAGCGKAREKIADKIAEKAAQKIAEKAIEKQSGGKVKADLAGNKVTIKGEKGEEVNMDGSGKAQLPEGFPKDVYVLEGAAMNTTARQENQYTVLMTSSEDQDKVLKTYKEKLAKNGWKETNSVDTGDLRMRTYEKESRQVMLSVAKDGGKTQVTLSATSEEAAKKEGGNGQSAEGKGNEGQKQE